MRKTKITNYIRGRNFEYRVKKLLEKKGYIVFRTAGSHGLFDLIAVRHIKGYFLIKLWQLKRNMNYNQASNLFKKIIQALGFVVKENDKFHSFSITKNIKAIEGYFSQGRIVVYIAVVYTSLKNGQN